MLLFLALQLHYSLETILRTFQVHMANKKKDCFFVSGFPFLFSFFFLFTELPYWNGKLPQEICLQECRDR